MRKQASLSHIHSFIHSDTYPIPTSPPPPSRFHHLTHMYTLHELHSDNLGGLSLITMQHTNMYNTQFCMNKVKERSINLINFLITLQGDELLMYK
jgi:hypothetical protein